MECNKVVLEGKGKVVIQEENKLIINIAGWGNTHLIIVVSNEWITVAIGIEIGGGNTHFRFRVFGREKQSTDNCLCTANAERYTQRG